MFRPEARRGATVGPEEEARLAAAGVASPVPEEARLGAGGAAAVPESETRPPERRGMEVD